MVLYTATLEDAEEICKYLGSNCIVCRYDWCDIAVDGVTDIRVFNATERLVDVVAKELNYTKHLES
jgi:hypothetical protein